MKKVIVVFMVFTLILSLCACNTSDSPQESSIEGETPIDAILPDSVCGEWYPQPETSDMQISIYNDGTCVIYGTSYEYTVDVQTDFDIVLIAGDHTLYLSQVNSPLPLLYEEKFGYFVPYPDLWPLEGDWYCAESGAGFTLSFADIPNWNCQTDVGDNCMDISYTDDAGTDYSVMIWMDYENPVAEVNSSAGDFWVFYNTAYRSDDSNHALEDLVEELNTVLDGGAVYEYIPEEDTYHALYGSEALAYLYPQFQQLNAPEAQDYLSHFERQPDALRYTDTTGYDPMSIRYNAYGHLTNGYVMSDILGEYIYYVYDWSDSISQVSILDTIHGTPVYDADGQLIAVDVTYGDAIYTAQLTYNEDQQIVRIDIPVPCSANIDVVPADSTEQHEFIYDANGKLLQSTVTVIPRDPYKYYAHDHYDTYGFSYKEVTEYIYDEDGCLIESRNHVLERPANAPSSWSYDKTEYFYSPLGQLLFTELKIYTVNLNFPSWHTVATSLFHSSGLVDSIGNKTIEAIGDYLDYAWTTVTEFTYEDIYVYVP